MTPETQPTATTQPQLTEAEKQARDKRNKAMAGALFLFVALIFLITIVRFYTNSHHGL
jgi:hypothetical protein